MSSKGHKSPWQVVGFEKAEPGGVGGFGSVGRRMQVEDTHILKNRSWGYQGALASDQTRTRRRVLVEHRMKGTGTLGQAGLRHALGYPDHSHLPPVAQYISSHLDFSSFLEESSDWLFVPLACQVLTVLSKEDTVVSKVDRVPSGERGQTQASCRTGGKGLTLGPLLLRRLPRSRF